MNVTAQQPCTPRIPREAREGLMRAWIALLQQRHPGVVWVPVESADITVEADCRVASHRPGEIVRA